MKILVTGSSGFLGRELVDRLRASGHEVRTLDRKVEAPTALDFPWTLGMSPNPNSLHEADVLIHLAWNTRDRDSTTTHINVGGSKKLFHAADIAGIRIINVSSLSAVNPKSNYGQAKRTVESFNKEGLNLRVAKVVSPQNKSKLLSTFAFTHRFLFLPVPSQVKVHTVDLDEFINQIFFHLSNQSKSECITLKSDSSSIKEFLRINYGIRSFEISARIFSAVFLVCSHIVPIQGKIWLDKWKSLVSSTEI